MLTIAKDMTITMSVHENAKIKVKAYKQDGTPFTFVAGDVVRFEFRQAWCMPWKYETIVESDTTEVTISIDELWLKVNQADATGGKTPFSVTEYHPIEYVYSIKLNPDGDRRVLVGCDSKGPKVFRVYVDT